MAVLGAGFLQLGRPALQWMDEAPEHVTVLRQRVQKLVPRLDNFNQAAVTADLKSRGATPKDDKGGAGFHIVDPDGFPIQISANKPG